MAKQHAPVDDLVKVPAAVRRAAANAEKLHGTVYSAEPPNEGPPKENSVEVKPAEEPKEKPEVKAEEKAPDPEKTEVKSSEPEKTEVKAEEVTSDSKPDFEHKYNSLKGRYDRAMQELRSYNNEMSALKSRLAELTNKVEAKPHEPAPQQTSTITEEEKRDYGDEFLDVVRRQAMASTSPDITRLAKDLETLKSQLDGVGSIVTTTARDRMLADLDKELPEWRNLNESDDFINWLQLPDPYSGGIRHELLKDAYSANQSPRVLAFFRGFLNEEATVRPANTSVPAPELQKESGAKVNMKDLAAPGRAASSAASRAPDEKPFISRAQIAQFYTDVAAGKYRGKQAEKDRLEKMIFEAKAEGRLTM